MRKELDAQCTKLIAAYKSRDVKAFMNFFASDYISKLLGGRTVNRQQREEQHKRDLTEMKSIDRISIEIQKLTTTGSEAVATIHIKASWMQADTQAAGRENEKDHKIEIEVQEKETWIRTPDGWKLKLTESMPGQKVWVDGKLQPSN